MGTRAAWRWCVAAGLAAFVCSWLFGRVPELVACGPPGALGPILAFEFVRSPADVAALFGAEPCRSTFAGAQRTGLLLDAIGFIPAYTTFLILAATASARITDRWPPFAMAVAAAVAFAGLCDEIEGVLLYLILADLPGRPMLVEALWWPVHVKFALLGLGTLGIGYLLVGGRRLAAIVAGVVVAVGALKALAGLAADTPAMMGGFTIGWVTILLAALAASVKPSLFSELGGPPPTPAPPTA